VKIKNEHYQVMAAAILPVLESHPDAREAYKKAGLSETRFAWDLLYASKIEGNSSAWISANLYSYLHDDHITTALKRIIA